jgi:5'-deoxynucleotidase YfbR-like HD superfamily hydrolase
MIKSSPPSTEQIMSLVGNVITPLFNIERTMVMPFDHTRHENVGEHSAALGLLAGALAEQIDADLNTSKVVEYALVHDIIEIHAGDITVWDTVALRSKVQNEAIAAERILKDFPMFPWIIRKYKEFEKLNTPEKRFVYALDKLYPHILILIADLHPLYPSWEAYKQTEDIAYSKIECFPALVPIFGELCTMFRQRPHFFSTPIPLNKRG